MNVRQSNVADVRAILDWLKIEYDQAGTGTGFWCNRDIIEKAHKTEKLLVLVEGCTGEPVAFQVGGLLSPGILEVHPNKRRKGYGRQLVEYCIERARSQDESVLHIDCNPASSVPFWKCMGFRLYSEAFGEKCPVDVRNHAFQILSKQHELPESDEGSIAVEVLFETECGFPLNKVDVSGIGQSPFKILLPHRVISFCPCRVFWGDTFVTVHVNGRTLYSGKAKYQEAEVIGVQRHDGETFFIDELILPNEGTDEFVTGQKRGDSHDS